jgi:predicted patatin/cPLA2 family phospholipase
MDNIRARANRAAGTVSDGRKVGLIIEGGAMRGVFSAGADIALAAAGLVRSFDVVYGCSSGALNAAYFLANQAALGATIYCEDLNNSKFISFLRPTRILNLDYLFDEIISIRKRLDIEAVLCSPTRFYVALTDAQSGDGSLVEAGNSEFGLLDTLRASATHPLLSDKSMKLGERTYFDGGFAKLLPIQDAIDSGCTDLLVILTRPRGYVEQPPDLILRQWFTWRCARGNDKLIAAGLVAHHAENAARDLAVGRATPPPGVNIATICPDETLPLSRTEKNGIRLWAGVHAGRRMASEALGLADSDPGRS